MKLDVSFVRTALPYAQIQGIEPQKLSFAFDSRMLQAGDIFVALPGQRTDGHHFIEAVHAQGAAGYMVRQDCVMRIPLALCTGKLIIAVPDTQQAFIDLAYAWRSACTVKLVAITGTVGKTSTKEMLAAIVAHAGYAAIVSPGNQNTLLGACHNILRITQEHQIAIVEVGISKRNEMKEIVQLLRPTYAAITGVGHQHMDGLGTLHDIAQEKRTIFSCFTEHNIGVINGDQPLLEDIAYAHPVIKFGLKTNNQIQARKINIHGETSSLILKIYNEKIPVTIPSNHRGYIMNMLAATALAYLLNIPPAVIAQAIQQLVIVPGRHQKLAITNNRGMLINDCYNANPESVKEALIALNHTAKGRPTIFVFGDMLGLGSEAPFWHRQIGRFLGKISSLARVILVGNLVEWTKNAAPRTIMVDHVANWQQAAEILAAHLTPNTVVLVKGSLDMNLGSLVNYFVQQKAM